MPVTGTPTTPVKLTEDHVRMFLRDYALGHLPGGQGNIILDDVQFTRDELTNAISFALDNFNAITPITSYTEENFPNRYILLLGTTKFLLMSESFHQLRNQVNVQDGDIAPSGIYEKSQAYIALARAIGAEWQELARGNKTQINMESAYGAVGSGYAYIGRGYYGW